ncbi:hypothetical protein RND71_021902 [Anisodus tanguticus]|uniref:Uncharacterized protein n=1 Tax=Anisodus tanguticus TaxID=243964 RepID=A0AAE1RYY1_9SOLA|nr:hypothetical protein RND71_021902 [Anisodus tanguticus]
MSILCTQGSMSQRPHRTSTGKAKVTSTRQPIGKWAAPRRAPPTNDMESKKYFDETPRFGIDVVEFHDQKCDEFPDVSTAEYDKFLRRPDYKSIRHNICGANSVAAWARDNDGCHKYVCRSDFKLAAKVPLAPYTVQFLGLAPSLSLPPDDDVNSVTGDDPNADTYYGVDYKP